MLAGVPWAAIGSNSAWMLLTCLSVHRRLMFCLLVILAISFPSSVAAGLDAD